MLLLRGFGFVKIGVSSGVEFLFGLIYSANGLKFVRESIDGLNQRLYCFSDNTIYNKGGLSLKIDPKPLKKAPGALTVIEWKLL